MRVIKAFIYLIIMIIISSIASAYVFYFVGMAFSLATASIITIGGEKVAMLFSAAGALLPTYIIVKLVVKGTEVIYKEDE